MHLQQQLVAELAQLFAPVNLQHAQHHYVCGPSLDGSIDGCALRMALGPWMARIDFRKIA